MRQSQGFALIATLLIGLVLVILVLGASISGLMDRGISANQQRSNTAYFIARAGLANVKTLAFHNLVDAFPYHKTDCSPVASIFGSGLSTSGVNTSTGDLIQPSMAPSDFSGTLGGGDYSVTPSVVGENLVLTSVAHFGGAKATVRDVVTPTFPGSVWANAVFANQAAPGSGVINGNVSVYGSLQIADANLSITDPALSTGGAAGIFDNYFGFGGSSGTGKAGSNIAKYVAPYISPDTGKYHPSQPPDLCARLKVNKGNVYLEASTTNLGTSASVTTTSSSGMTYTYNTVPIYSVNLGEGNLYQGKPGSATLVTNWNNGGNVNLKYPPGGSGDPNSGYGAYHVAFPGIAASVAAHPGFNIKLSGSGTDPSGCSWLVQGTTFTLPPKNPPTTQGTCTNGTDEIDWVNGHLVIKGHVNLLGNSSGTALDFTGNNPIDYTGTGTLRVGVGWDSTTGTTVEYGPASTSMATELQAGTVVDGVWTVGGFPTDAALSFVTPGDLAISKPLNAPTAFLAYALGNADLSKAGSQMALLGALVANTFDMGTTVPNIVYVPGVQKAADDLCLPGAFDGPNCPMGSNVGRPGAGRIRLDSSERF